MDRVPKIPLEGGKKLEEIKGNLVLKNANFSYKKDKNVLSNINFECTPGKITALVNITFCFFIFIFIERLGKYYR